MPFLGGFLAIAFLLSNPVQTFASEPSAPSDIPAPQVPVKGTVVDINGEPLIGVGVLVKGTNTGAVTGLDGSFTVNASPDDILVFSSVGFVELELPASADLSRVVLEEDSELLDEVIVIGSQGDFSARLDDMADAMGTINYELACRFGMRMLRVYV